MLSVGCSHSFLGSKIFEIFADGAVHLPLILIVYEVCADIERIDCNQRVDQDLELLGHPKSGFFTKIESITDQER